MPERMFDGFDHTRHRKEVEERWGRTAYARGDSWWRSRSEDEQKAFEQELTGLDAGWVDAASRGVLPTSAEAQDLARRHVTWLSGVPGVPRDDDGSVSREYLRGLGDMYVTDPRFASNYGGRNGAELVQAALGEWLVRSD